MEGANNPSPYPHALTQDEGRPKGGPLYLAGRGQEANLIDSARPVPRPSAISYADVRLSIHHRQVQKGQPHLSAQLCDEVSPGSKNGRAHARKKIRANLRINAF